MLGEAGDRLGGLCQHTLRVGVPNRRIIHHAFWQAFEISSGMMAARAVDFIHDHLLAGGLGVSGAQPSGLQCNACNQKDCVKSTCCATPRRDATHAPSLVPPVSWKQDHLAVCLCARQFRHSPTRVGKSRSGFRRTARMELVEEGKKTSLIQAVTMPLVASILKAGFHCV